MRQGVYAFFDYKPQTGDMLDEVMAGLRSSPKTLSPKFFYDERGSALFEQITNLNEYYLTRTEMGLFDAHLPEISNIVGNGVCLIEYGSGSSLKIRKVLETMAVDAYVPIDISEAHLQANAKALHADYPEIDVFPVCADLTQPFELPAACTDMRKVGFFPGSSIGNFEPAQAQSFLRVVRETVGVDGHLIIGVDRKKATDVLEAAYNDVKGVTAEFNLNVLDHINATLGADFDLNKFSHEAAYNADEGCIQMFLTSQETQEVAVAGERVLFSDQERVHTENSYKYHATEFSELAGGAGFEVQKTFSDEREWFSLYLLRGV